MNERESCSEGSQSSIILETTTSHFEDYTTSSPSEQEEYDIAHIDRFYHRRYFQNAAEYLDDDETNYELISLTTNTHTQHCKTETEETETDTYDSEHKLSQQQQQANKNSRSTEKLINYDSVYLSSEEGTDELSKQAETVKDTQLLSPLSKKKCTVMNDYNEAAINLVSPIHTSDCTNLTENQYFSLPDVSIGRSLKVSECIDDDLRFSYNCSKYADKDDTICCREGLKSAKEVFKIASTTSIQCESSIEDIAKIKINRDKPQRNDVGVSMQFIKPVGQIEVQEHIKRNEIAMKEEDVMTNENIAKQVLFKMNARSLSMPKISRKIQCDKKCFTNDNAQIINNAKAIRRHSSLYDKVTKKESQLTKVIPEAGNAEWNMWIKDKVTEIIQKQKNTETTTTNGSNQEQESKEQMKMKPARANVEKHQSEKKQKELKMKHKTTNIETTTEHTNNKQINATDAKYDLNMKHEKTRLESSKKHLKIKNTNTSLESSTERVKMKQATVNIGRPELAEKKDIAAQEQLKAQYSKTNLEQIKMKQLKEKVENDELVELTLEASDITPKNTISETPNEHMKINAKKDDSVVPTKEQLKINDKISTLETKHESKKKITYSAVTKEQIKVKPVTANVVNKNNCLEKKQEKTDIKIAVEEMKAKKQQHQQQQHIETNNIQQTVKQMKIVHEKETHEVLNSRPKPTVTTTTTTTTTTTLVKSNSPVIVNVENTAQNQQAFDHIRYKVLKSEQIVCTNMLSKLPICNNQSPTQLDELLRKYLKEYSFHELFKQNNNVVIVEPVRSNISCPFLKHMQRLEADNQQNGTFINCNRLKKHFFLQPIRVNKELYESELPSPNTVRKVRKFFEERQIIIRGKTLNNALHNIKNNTFKDNHALTVEQKDMEQTECILTATTSAPHSIETTAEADSLSYLHLTNGKFGYNFSKQIEGNRLACVRVQDVIKRHNRMKSDASSLQESLTTTSAECKQITKDFQALTVDINNKHSKCKSVTTSTKDLCSKELMEERLEKPQMEVTTIEQHLSKSWSVIDKTLKRHYVSNDKLYGTKKYDDIEFEEYEIYKHQCFENFEALNHQQNALNDVPTSTQINFDKTVDTNQHQVSANKIHYHDNNNTSITTSTYDKVCISKEMPSKEEEGEQELLDERETTNAETDCYDSLD